MRTPINTKEDKKREGFLEIKNLERGDEVYFLLEQPTFNKFGLVDYVGRRPGLKVRIMDVQVKGGYTTITYVNEKEYQSRFESNFWDIELNRRFRSKTRCYFIPW